VKYPPEMLTGLSYGVRSRRMEPADRIHLLDDQFALLLCGMGSTIEVNFSRQLFVKESSNSSFDISVAYIHGGVSRRR